MKNYNSDDLGFKPLRKRAQPLRKTREVKTGEPETRLPPKPQSQLRYDDPEMAEREKKAQEEIAYKATCTAILYNKGAYQYVYSEEQARDVGKKSS